MVVETVEFENHGYFKEYYVNGKYLGSIVITEKDREELGYGGKRTEVTTEELLVGKAQTKIKKGTTVVTQLQQICGRRIN